MNLEPATTGLDALYGRSLLTTHDWSTDDLDTLLAAASRLPADIGAEVSQV